jgi:hypothetical protein
MISQSSSAPMLQSQYRLVRAVLMWVCLAMAPGAWAQSLAGTWQSDFPGGSMTLRLQVRGNVVSGVIESGGRLIANLSGTAQGDNARGAASSPEGQGSFEIQVRQDAMSLVLEQEAGPQQQAARLPLAFRRLSMAPSQSASSGAGIPSRNTMADASDAGGDPRLVGRWSSQEVIVSSGASLASEQLLAFGADGTVVSARGRAAGGAAGWSFDGGAGGGAERGRWRARDGSLFIERSNGQWARIGRYGMTDDGRILRIIDDSGGRTLWSRR